MNIPQKSFWQELEKLSEIRELTKADVKEFKLKHVALEKPWTHLADIANGHLRGYAAYDPKVKELKQLWVSPKDRRQGVASGLLDRLGPIEKLRVRGKNFGAQDFYRTRGLEIKGPHPDNPGGSLLMTARE